MPTRRKAERDDSPRGELLAAVALYVMVHDLVRSLKALRASQRCENAKLGCDETGEMGVEPCWQRQEREPCGPCRTRQEAHKALGTAAKRKAHAFNAMKRKLDAWKGASS